MDLQTAQIAQRYLHRWRRGAHSRRYIWQDILEPIASARVLPHSAAYDETEQLEILSTEIRRLEDCKTKLIDDDIRVIEVLIEVYGDMGVNMSAYEAELADPEYRKFVVGSHVPGKPNDRPEPHEEDTMKVRSVTSSSIYRVGMTETHFLLAIPLERMTELLDTSLRDTVARLVLDSAEEELGIRLYED